MDASANEHLAHPLAGTISQLDNLLAYYINLDDSTYRRAHMEKAVCRSGLPAKRFAAISYDRVSAGEFDNRYLVPQGVDAARMRRFLAEGTQATALNRTVACYVSHAEVLQKLKAELAPEQLGLVLEDDVDVVHGWQQMLSSILEAAPQGWQLLKLSGWGQLREEDRLPTVKSFTRASSSFYTMRGPFYDSEDSQAFYYGGSAAYMVRGSSVDAVLTHLKSRTISDFDEMLLSYPNSTLRCYEVYPHPFDLAPRAIFSEIRPNGLTVHARWLRSKLSDMSTAVSSLLTDAAGPSSILKS